MSIFTTPRTTKLERCMAENERLRAALRETLAAWAATSDIDRALNVTRRARLVLAGYAGEARATDKSEEGSP